ncbi:hypothetical protein HDV05_007202 [Chytridiales sp. JEL 0842]|nr:hypothetical protein HDV05_007202 [Chytridiales sp. JEL 0842]
MTVPTSNCFLTLSNGTKIPALAYGTGTSWFVGASANDRTVDQVDRKCVDAVKEALYAGFRHIDTAEIYGTELEVGVALSEFMKETNTPRSEIYVTTKVYSNISNIPLALENSLKRLGPAVEYVDLYLIHSPFWDKTKETFKGAWEKMEGLLEGGKVKSIGVSNYRVKDLEELKTFAKVMPACNQIEYNPYLQGRDIKSFCDQHQIIIEAYTPLGPLTAFATAGPLASAVLSEIGSKYGNLSPSQVLVLWCLQKGNVVVTTTGKKERMKEYLSAQKKVLEKEDMEKIDSYDMGCRKYWVKDFAQ